LPVSYEDVGIDLGVTHFAALSNGIFIDNPRYYRTAEKKLKKLQEALTRKKRGSHRRKKAVQAVAKAHRKIANQRKDFLHKQSRKLVNTHQVIVFEDLTPLEMGKSKGRGMRKSIMDVAWAQFIEMTIGKAAEAGRTVILVDPRNTSKMCSQCGELVQKTLSTRTHTCPNCGLVLDRDVNAALNILQRGLQTLRL
jgi:putative transposase